MIRIIKYQKNGNGKNNNESSNGNKWKKGILGVVIAVVILVVVAVVVWALCSNLKKDDNDDSNSDLNIEDSENDKDKDDDKVADNDKDENDDKSADNDKDDNETANDDDNKDDDNNDLSGSGRKFDISSGYLTMAQSLFDKVEIGMTSDQVIDAIGEPTNIKSNDFYTEFEYVADDRFSTSLVEVFIYDSGVYDVTIPVTSYKLSQIELSKELGTEIEDLNDVASEVKEGMTFDEIIEVLGDKYFAYDKASTAIAYSWYDKKENYITVFIRSSNNKASLVTSVHTTH